HRLQTRGRDPRRIPRQPRRITRARHTPRRGHPRAAAAHGDQPTPVTNASHRCPGRRATSRRRNPRGLRATVRRPQRMAMATPRHHPPLDAVLLPPHHPDQRRQRVKGNHPMFVDIHALHTLPYSNVNRDNLGAPKSCWYGGTERIRVSSQAWKRAIRKAVEQDLEQPTERTRRIASLVAGILTERGWGAEDARRAGRAVIYA